jgi:hypothetical protein
VPMVAATLRAGRVRDVQPADHATGSTSPLFPQQGDSPGIPGGLVDCWRLSR